ncbi:MAG: TetR/AcrR family transcriptional regulator [Ruminococcaceae bacterium]|nr:TetR/AcrR family transcriptional regulator [Oscillospiraceae bacterium]
MDRRQHKTRKAVFDAFSELLSVKSYHHITVGDILARADIGRATFYAHFETKDYLLKELCEELFCHIFDAASDSPPAHDHIFRCDAPESVFLHLFEHLAHNDRHLLQLLTGQNALLFSPYFKSGLRRLVQTQLPLFEARRHAELPDDFWIDHIVSCFMQTLLWWLENGKQQSAATVTSYFLLSV